MVMRLIPTVRICRSEGKTLFSFKIGIVENISTDG